jgi:Domain of unknown function (DUF4266)
MGKKKYWILCSLFLLSACHTVKRYQRFFLNDHAMQTGKGSIEKLSSSVHAYKEAASGGGSGKTSGGCGCN